MWTASWQALFWRFERFDRLRSYVRPVFADICPLALMKSDDLDPYQSNELLLMLCVGLFQIFGGDHVVHHVFALAKLELEPALNSSLDGSLY